MPFGSPREPPLSAFRGEAPFSGTSLYSPAMVTVSSIAANLSGRVRLVGKCFAYQLEALLVCFQFLRQAGAHCQVSAEQESTHAELKDLPAVRDK